jgi:DNA-binding LacI/PurR family transcriptional regulator
MRPSKPKYRTIADDLRQKILSGHLVPGSVMPSEFDLMGRYGIGRKTARAALRVLIQEGRISVRQGARAIVLGPSGSRKIATRIFGVSYFGVPSLSHPYNISVLRGIHSVFRNYHHELDLIDLSIEDGSRFEGPNRYKFHRCEGIFLMSPDFDDQDLEALSGAGKSLVTLGVTLKHRWVPVREVLADAERGLRNLIGHLLDLGHRKVGVLFVVPYERKATRYLNRVVLDCLNEAVHRDGLEIRPGWIREAAEFSREAGYRSAIQLLSGNGEKPTVLFTIDEMLALGVQEAARELGLTVPEQLSITAIGNHFPEVELTTVAVPGFNLGVRAARIMLAACDGKEIAPMAPLPTPLVIGKTTTFAPRAEQNGNGSLGGGSPPLHTFASRRAFVDVTEPENEE